MNSLSTFNSTWQSQNQTNAHLIIIVAKCIYQPSPARFTLFRENLREITHTERREKDRDREIQKERENTICSEV